MITDPRAHPGQRGHNGAEPASLPCPRRAPSRPERRRRGQAPEPRQRLYHHGLLRLAIPRWQKEAADALALAMEE